MRVNVKQGWLTNSVLLSVFLHLLFLCSIFLIIAPEFNVDEQAKKYVPAYTYTQTAPVYTSGKVSSKHARNLSHLQSQSASPQTSQAESTSTASESARKLFLNESNFHPQETILDTSQRILQEVQANQTMEDLKQVEPMLMIGNSTSASDPFMQLLSRVLSAHFKYPPMEEAAQVTGRVVLAMVLHPEGNFTNVHVLESSDNVDFDRAALYAVNSAPVARGADRFLSKPKYLIIGFIFGGEPPL